jgi:hypothetical protein
MELADVRSWTWNSNSSGCDRKVSSSISRSASGWVADWPPDPASGQESHRRAAGRAGHAYHSRIQE